MLSTQQQNAMLVKRIGQTSKSIYRQISFGHLLIANNNQTTKEVFIDLAEQKEKKNVSFSGAIHQSRCSN